MKILITGGNGFIAKSLVEALSSKYDISSCNRQQLDLLDFAAVEEHIKKWNYDVVIHAATYDAAPACSTKDPAKVLEDNLKMFFHLARCENYFGKMIYFGSGAEFACDYWMPRMSEAYFDWNVPSDQYGLSKYIMTRYALKSRKIYNLRLFGLFGKYDDWRYRYIPNSCCRAVLGMPIEMKQNRVFDFMYIDDFVTIVQHFIGHDPKNRVYNVCTGTTHDFQTLAQMIVKTSGKDLEIVAKQAGIGIEYSGSNDLLLNELSDFSFTPMQEAIDYLYQWYHKNPMVFNKDEFV